MVWCTAGYGATATTSTRVGTDTTATVAIIVTAATTMTAIGAIRTIAATVAAMQEIMSVGAIIARVLSKALNPADHAPVLATAICIHTNDGNDKIAEPNAALAFKVSAIEPEVITNTAVMAANTLSNSDPENSGEHSIVRNGNKRNNVRLNVLEPNVLEPNGGKPKRYRECAPSVRLSNSGERQRRRDAQHRARGLTATRAQNDARRFRTKVPHGVTPDTARRFARRAQQPAKG